MTSKEFYEKKEELRSQLEAMQRLVNEMNTAARDNAYEHQVSANSFVPGSASPVNYYVHGVDLACSSAVALDAIKSMLSSAWLLATDKLRLSD